MLLAEVVHVMIHIYNYFSIPIQKLIFPVFFPFEWIVLNIIRYLSPWIWIWFTFGLHSHSRGQSFNGPFMIINEPDFKSAFTTL